MKARWQRFWAWWVAWCDREDDARALALVRIVVPLLLAIDLIQVARLGLVTDIYRPSDLGGMVWWSDKGEILTSISPMWAGPVAWGLCLVALLLVSSGVAMKPAIVAVLILHAQLGHLWPAGDRGIDRLLRTVLLILLFTRVNQRWSLARLPRIDTLPAWPSDLIRYLLLMVYLASGIGKLVVNPLWVAWSGTPVLYRILADPTAAKMDAVALMEWAWLMRLGGWFTIALELTPFVLFTRWAPPWAVLAIGMHLGIAATMDLGIFSFGIIALYPAALAPWVGGWITALEVRRATHVQGKT